MAERGLPRLNSVYQAAGVSPTWHRRLCAEPCVNRLCKCIATSLETSKLTVYMYVLHRARILHIRVDYDYSQKPEPRLYTTVSSTHGKVSLVLQKLVLSIA